MSYARLPDLSISTSSSQNRGRSFMPNILSNPENSNAKPAITNERRRKLLFSYAPDWLLTLSLAGVFFTLDKVSGFKREFSLSDTSLRHTFTVHERVPNFALYLICFGAPFVLLPLINFLTIRSWWDLHNSNLGLALGLSITGSITQFVKITVGRPRPDVIARCGPPPGLVDPPYGLTTATICTQTDIRILRDGFRSFPSGHSSMSFAGLGFLAYYLAGKLHLFDRRGHTGKAWLSLTPFSAAALVAISRTMDYRHHWQDVLTGSLLGTVVSYFAYRQYYPSLASEMSHQPYSPRIKREEVEALPMHYQHDDSGSTHISFHQPPVPGRSRSQRYNDTVGDYGQDLELQRTTPRPNPDVLEEIRRDRLAEASPTNEASPTRR